MTLSASSASSGGCLIDEKTEVGQREGKEHARRSNQDANDEDQEDRISVHKAEESTHLS
jgi:hypothetical protein